MKNWNYLKFITIVAMFIAIVALPINAFSEDAPLFQIVVGADAVANLESYEGGSITAITDTLGAPSAAWFNPSDETLIDYIYVGQSNVLTFQVLKETKAVSKVLSEARGSWENGGCHAYPKCPTNPAA